MPQDKQKKFIIIDGNALVHRAWHALPPLKTDEGELVNAVYGFTSILLKTLKEFQPEYITVTFDRREPTFRHEEYEEYKATREKQPDELYDQIPRIKEVVRVFNIPIYEKAGYEADDLIGTICALKSVDRKDLHSIIVTGDMDTLQLVDDNTFVYALKKGISDAVLYDEQAVKNRYGLRPGQLIDYKGLRGDPSDNIPGVKGVGEKTAIALLQDFKTLENIFKNLDSPKIKPRIRKLLEEYKDDAFMSKKLATILKGAPVDFNLEDCFLKDLDTEKIIKLFQELNFKTLIKKIPGLEAVDTGSSKKKLKIRSNNYNYFLINTGSELEKFTDKLKKQKVFCLDTETTSLDARQAELLGISFSWKKGEAYYFPCNKEDFAKNKKLSEIKNILQDKKIKKFGHHIKYDLEVLCNAGINLQGIDFDTMLASYLLDPGSRRHNLDSLVFRELGHQMISYEDLVGKGKDQISISEVPLENLAEYSCEDADFTYRLRNILEPLIEKEKLEKVLWQIEVPLIEVLASIEEAGVKIDKNFLQKMSSKVGKRLEKLSLKIYEIAGVSFNINSPAQLKEILFNKLQISTKGLKRTKTGISTAASELEKLRGQHKIIDLIFEHRELSKLKSTYLDALPNLINKQTGRVHASFNQTITSTGRLSSSNPNLQNIPIRTELGREIRKAFIAEPGNKIIALDYSQIELRVLAHMANDPAMIEAFNRGEDIHNATAAKIWNVEPEKVTKEMRRSAKAINFGVSYGMGVRGLAQGAGISMSEAKDFIDKYFLSYGKIKEFMEEQKQKAKDVGYVETIFGRKRYLPDITSGLPQLRAGAERMAINMPVQGTAADIMKIAMIKIHKKIGSISSKAKMIIQVHDELVFEVPEQDIKEVTKFAKQEMKNAVKLKIPLEVDADIGDNWEEAK